MPIDPKQLKALVDVDEDNPGDEEALDEEEGDESDPLADMGEFANMLRENAEDLAALADEIEEQLGENPEPSEETRAKIAEDVSKMPGALQEGFKQYIADKSFPECEAIAQKLSEEGKVDDPEKFAGWLYWAGKQ